MVALGAVLSISLSRVISSWFVGDLLPFLTGPHIASGLVEEKYIVLTSPGSRATSRSFNVKFSFTEPNEGQQIRGQSSVRRSVYQQLEHAAPLQIRYFYLYPQFNHPEADAPQWMDWFYFSVTAITGLFFVPLGFAMAYVGLRGVNGRDSHL